MPFLFSLLVLLAVCVGVAFLQVYLSKKSFWLWGWVLPVLSFLSSLPLLIFALLESLTGGADVPWGYWTWFASNIPTIALICICFSTRKRERARADMDRMVKLDL
jgi:hypothetical protein